VKETIRYALFVNCPDPNITNEEIRRFISILYLSGYNELPSKKIILGLIGHEKFGRL